VYGNDLASRDLWMRLNRPGLPLEELDVAVIGAPYDGSVTHARGAALAPAALRALSADSWFFTEDGVDLRSLRIRDLGDAPVDPAGAAVTQRAIAEAVRPVVRAGAIPLVLGGDHSITSGAVAGVVGEQPLGVLWLDAHADLMDSYKGVAGREESRWSHACPLRIAGSDVVEVAPPLDHNQITAWVAIRAIGEMFGHLVRTKQRNR